MAQAQAADRRSNKNEKKDELVEKLVHINRVATVSYTHLTLPTT